MEVWRIKRLEKDSYTREIFGTRIQAIAAIPRILTNLVISYKLDRRAMWSNVKVDELFRTGEYYSYDLGFHWIVEKLEFPYRKKEDTVNSNTMLDWCANFNLLKDGVTYDVELANGEVEPCIFNEELGIFQGDNEVYDINFVTAFKEAE